MPGVLNAKSLFVTDSVEVAGVVVRSSLGERSIEKSEREIFFSRRSRSDDDCFPRLDVEGVKEVSEDGTT